MGLIALDARVGGLRPEVSQTRFPETAIRAYPARYVSPWTMKDGAVVTIRPIRPRMSRPWPGSTRRSPSAASTCAISIS